MSYTTPQWSMSWVQLSVSSGQNLAISTWLQLDVALSYHAELGFPEVSPSKGHSPFPVPRQCRTQESTEGGSGGCSWISAVALSLLLQIASLSQDLSLRPPFPGAGFQLDLNFQSSCKDCSKVSPEKTIYLPPSPSPSPALLACSMTFLSFWIFTRITQNTTFKCTSRWPLHWFT